MSYANYGERFWVLNMGRNPTPTAVLDARGSFIAHPENKRDAEPKPRHLLSRTPPKDLKEGEKVIWKELMKILPPGVAYNSDLWAIRHLVIIETKSRGPDGITDSEHTKLLAYLDRFGLNAAARTKIQVEAPAKSKLDKFINRKAKPAPAPPPVEPETTIQ